MSLERDELLRQVQQVTSQLAALEANPAVVPTTGSASTNDSKMLSEAFFLELERAAERQAERERADRERQAERERADRERQAERERVDRERQVERERADRERERMDRAEKADRERERMDRAERADRERSDRMDRAERADRERAYEEARLVAALTAGTCTCGLSVVIVGAALLLTKQHT